MADVDDGSRRAVVISTDPRVRLALGGLLIAGGSIQLVGEAATRSEASAAVASARPHVVVIDVDRCDAGPWLDLIAALRGHGGTFAVVALGDSSTPATDALAAGADAFVSKLAPPRTICDAVDQAVRRRAQGPDGSPPGRRLALGPRCPPGPDDP